MIFQPLIVPVVVRARILISTKVFFGVVADQEGTT